LNLKELGISAKKMSQKFLLPVSDNSYKLIPSIRVDEYIG